MSAADLKVWLVTFHDGSWVKMVGSADIFAAFEQAGHEFGEFKGMESLPETDAAVIAFKAKATPTQQQIDFILSQELTLTRTLEALGMTHARSGSLYRHDIFRDGQVVASVNADECWDWIKAGCVAETAELVGA